MQDIYDTIIIGAGMAGLSAALYLRRASKKVLILESTACGGQILKASNVENYPGIASISGYDLITSLVNQVKSLDCPIKMEKVLEITKEKRVITSKNTYQAKSIIIATGLIPKKLNILLEDKFIGKGISYCATCDGAFFKEKVVAVVGGGNSAIEDTLYLSNIAKKVYLIHRREEFRAEDINLKKVKEKDNIEIILKANVLELQGQDVLESIVLDNNKTLNVDGLFIAIGSNPNTQIFQDLITLDETGFIVTHNDVETNIKGIYAIGDVRAKELRQLTTAVSDGAIVSKKITEYLTKINEDK